MSMRPVHATEGWGWARAARRRLADAQQPFGDPIEATDRDFDLAQAVTALARALRSAKAVRNAVHGVALPEGHDWDALESFSRRARNALEHGEERLDDPGVGYLFRREGEDIVVYDKPKGATGQSSARCSIRQLAAAVDALEAWFELETRI